MRRTTHRTTLGPAFSEAARLLWAWLKERLWSPTDLQRELGVAGGTVSRLLYGDRRPSLKLAVAIEELTGIAVAKWNRRPASSFRPPAAA